VSRGVEHGGIGTIMVEGRILVTGGTGFIGSALCRLLIETTDSEVVNVDKLTYAANPQSLASIAADPRYRFLKLDICDAEGMRALMRNAKPDAIVHLAAETHVDRSIDSSAEFIQTNIVGTRNLLEAAREYWSELADDKRDAFRFLMVSTDEVYGSLSPDDSAFTEETRYDPSSPYAASKAAADHLALAWHRTYGLPVIISNCSNNFGPCQFPEKLIPLSILNALEQRPISIYGEGKNIRDWLYVDDHARGLVTILRRGRVGRKYNVGARNERSNLEVVQALCGLLDRLVPASTSYRNLIMFVPDRPGHDLRYAIDPSRLEQETDWRPAASFEEALRQTVEWYLNNRAWWEPLRRQVYAGGRLGTAGLRR
jgi:dTDP-glucose 4,6-dehydratase